MGSESCEQVTVEIDAIDHLLEDAFCFIQVMFMDPWNYGYAVDSLRLTHWILSLDNLLAIELPEEFLEIETLLAKERSFRNISRTIANSRTLQEQSLSLLLLLLSQVDPSNITQREGLENLQNFAYSKLLFGPWFQNSTPQSSIPVNAVLRMRLFNPIHLFRWKLGMEFHATERSIKVGSQWVPDLQAICELNDLIRMESLPLRCGYQPVTHLIPLGSQTLRPIDSLHDFYEVLVNPARTFRSPAPFHPSVIRCVQSILGLDLAKISAEQSKFTRLMEHLNESSSYIGRKHLYADPLMLGHPFLPGQITTFDEPVFLNSSFRSRSGSSTKLQPWESLFRGLANLPSLLNKLGPDEIYGLYQEIRLTSKDKLVSLSQQLNTSITQENLSPENPRISKVKVQPMSIRRKAELMRKKRETNIRYNYPLSSPLNSFDESNKDYEEEPFLTNELLLSIFDSEEWMNNPSGFFLLAKRLIMAADKEQKSSLPDLENLEKLFQEAADSKSDKPIEDVLKSCMTISENLDEDKLKKLVAVSKDLPVIHQVFSNEFYSSEARRLIREQKWDLLPKKERAELGTQARKKHVQKLAAVKLDQFLKKDLMSPNEIKTLSKLTVDLLEQLIHFLQNQSESHPVIKTLKSDLSKIHSRHEDRLKRRVEGMDSDFVLECQIWLQSLCTYLHAKNSESYFSVMQNIEDLFQTVWKKVEQNLLTDLVV